jgi:hypothetical protein
VFIRQRNNDGLPEPTEQGAGSCLRRRRRPRGTASRREWPYSLNSQSQWRFIETGAHHAPDPALQVKVELIRRETIGQVLVPYFENIPRLPYVFWAQLVAQEVVDSIGLSIKPSGSRDLKETQGRDHTWPIPLR